ncbi:GNAT family N-acetyltransferase [Maritalea sp.]|uniref:GNAT family N-acetyltransferase n=1 Tax=Maritalea sp. TaxID=2003361 RepID=UPI003EF7A32B
MAQIDKLSTNVSIRTPIKSDVMDRLDYGFSNEIRTMYGVPSGPVPKMQLEHAREWFDRLSKHPCAWSITFSGRLVGEARLDNVDQHDRRARMAIGLFGEADLNKGIGRRAIKLVLKHGFEVLDLHRIDLRVLAFNKRAIRCYLACGFIQEGIERESANIAGKWHDDVMMSILDREFSNHG